MAEEAFCLKSAPDNGRKLWQGTSTLLPPPFHISGDSLPSTGINTNRRLREGGGKIIVNKDGSKVSSKADVRIIVFKHCQCQYCYIAQSVRPTSSSSSSFICSKHN